MRMPALEVCSIGDPDFFTITSEDRKGEKSDITIHRDQIKILIIWLQALDKNI